MSVANLRHHAISGLISSLIIAGGLASFWLLTNKPKTPAAEAAIPAPPTVETVPLVTHDGTLDISVDGTVVPFREISTSAEVAGRITSKAGVCDAGKFVTAGTLLLEIDSSDYDFEVQRLTNQLAEATASIEELEVEISSTETLIALAQEDLVLQQRELARMTNLATGNVVTASDLDRTKQAELTARNALALLKNQERLQKTRRNRVEASRKLVETQLDKAKADLARTRVVAPTDGVVVQDLVEQGDYVQKGEPLVTIEDTSSVEVKCSLQMDELYWLWRSQADHAGGNRQASGPYEVPQAPVTVSYELPQFNLRYQWNGQLDRFDGIGMDERTRTVPCRVLVDDPRGVTVSQLFPSVSPADQSAGVGPPALVRGMYVKVRIEVDQTGDLVRIPENTVHPGKALWVVRDGKLRVVKPLRLIELMKGDGGAGDPPPYWIADAAASGLKPSDAVVVTPLTAVIDGMEISLEGSR